MNIEEHTFRETRNILFKHFTLLLTDTACPTRSIQSHNLNYKVQTYSNMPQSLPKELLDPSLATITENGFGNSTKVTKVSDHLDNHPSRPRSVSVLEGNAMTLKDDQGTELGNKRKDSGSSRLHRLSVSSRVSGGPVRRVSRLGRCYLK